MFFHIWAKFVSTLKWNFMQSSLRSQVCGMVHDFAMTQWSLVMIEFFTSQSNSEGV